MERVRTSSVTTNGDQSKSVIESQHSRLVLLTTFPRLERSSTSTRERHVDFQLDSMVTSINILPHVRNSRHDTSFPWVDDLVIVTGNKGDGM